MIPSLRQQFNEKFSPEKYRALLRRVDEACGMHVQFRISETPCFFPKSLIDRMASDGQDLVRQLVNNPAYRAKSDEGAMRERAGGEPEDGRERAASQHECPSPVRRPGAERDCEPRCCARACPRRRQPESQATPAPAPAAAPTWASASPRPGTSPARRSRRRAGAG